MDCRGTLLQSIFKLKRNINLLTIFQYLKGGWAGIVKLYIQNVWTNDLTKNTYRHKHKLLLLFHNIFK